MTDLEKYELVNKCETAKELEAAIYKCSDVGGVIIGITNKFREKDMVEKVKGVLDGTIPPNYLTRKWGIRQQALYIKYYHYDK